MAGNLKMTTSELTAAKGVIATQNDTLSSVLDAIYKQITSLVGSTWTGDAANQAKEQMDLFYNKTYTAYKEAVQGHVSFIENTVTRYDTTEDTIKSNATQQIDSSA